MISATRYPYSDEQCLHLHGIVCAAIRDAKIKFTPLSYAVFYQAAMNGFSCALSDELLNLEKGKTLEYGLNGLYHKYIGESCINNIALLDDITENLHQGSHKIVTITEQSSAVLDQLQKLNVQKIKVDKSFLNFKDKRSLSILDYVVKLSKDIGISAMVEGVETPQQQEVLMNFGYQKFQGYLYGKPAMLVA